MRRIRGVIVFHEDGLDQERRHILRTMGWSAIVSIALGCGAPGPAEPPDDQDPPSDCPEGTDCIEECKEGQTLDPQTGECVAPYGDGPIPYSDTPYTDTPPYTDYHDYLDGGYPDSYSDIYTDTYSDTCDVSMGWELNPETGECECNSYTDGAYSDCGQGYGCYYSDSWW